MKKYLFCFIGIPFLLIIVSILLSIAFFTLIEVRILGVVHQRIGPIKVGIIGIFQPLGDFLKLFGKNIWFPKKIIKTFFILSPIISILVGILVWAAFGTYFPISRFKWTSISFFILRRVLVYFLFIRGWSSGSLFSLLGSFRSVSQAISYEVILFFILFPFIVYYNRFKINEIFLNSFIILILLVPLFIVWLFSCLAESNRSPFDFSEGESELVSGFNTEILGGFFTFIFITEYGFIIFLGFITVLFFIGTYLFWIKHLLIISFFLLVRAAYPRMRFDFLIIIIWKKLLPLVIRIIIFFLRLVY
jgi:NADH-ubiquinone oxidoreductase chain 1